MILKLQKGNPWVYGVLVNNVWSVSNSGSSPSYSNFLMQPFVNHNFPGVIGHLFHVGPLPVNTQLGVYYNGAPNDDGPNWQLRFQVQLLFPK